MSSDLSPFAIHGILNFAKDHRTEQHLRKVNGTWNRVYTQYFLHDRPPPMECLRSLELALFVKKDLDDAAMRSIFGHGKPLAFDSNRPRLLVPAIVEAFQQLKEEPSFLVVTLDVSDDPRLDVSAMWPQVYADHLPCGACRTADELEEAKKMPRKIERRPEPSAGEEQDVIEKFHIRSEEFDKQLTVELNFVTDDREKNSYCVQLRPPTAPEWEKSVLRKVTIHLETNRPCSVSPSGKARTSKSLLLDADFASEVYGFLDRVHVGTSLIAKRALNELIFKLQEPFAGASFSWKAGRPFFTGAYWMIVRHFRRDLPYSDMRRFKLPSEAGPAADCALIVRYLSNGHFFCLKTPLRAPEFAVKMLAALVGRNVSVDTLRIRARGGGLSDYRSMDTVFNGGMRLATLELSLFDTELITLVKTTDFFRMPMVQRLNALKLCVAKPCQKTEGPGQRAIASSPLWIAGIHRLRNCERFEVWYDSDCQLRTICLKLVQLCEKFERGAKSRSSSRTSSSQRVT